MFRQDVVNTIDDVFEMSKQVYFTSNFTPNNDKVVALKAIRSLSSASMETEYPLPVSALIRIHDTAVANLVKARECRKCVTLNFTAEDPVILHDFYFFLNR